MAVSVRAEPRFTRDIDLAVAVADDASAETLVSSLQGRGYSLQLSLEQAAIGRLATVRLLAPGARVGHLVATKLLATAPDRPQDEVDLLALLTHLNPGEHARTVAAVERIQQLGANRGMSLKLELDERIRRHPSTGAP